MTTWEYYSKRRNIDLAEFVKKNNLSYQDLCEFCNSRKVSPPPESLYKLSMPKQSPKPKPKKAAKPVIKKEATEQKVIKPKRKYTRKPTTKAKK